MGKLKTLFKDTAVYGISTIVGRLLFFFITPIYVSSFEPKIYGILTDVYSLSAFVVILLAYGLETAYFKFSKSNSLAASTAFWGTVGSSTLFGILLYCFYPELIEWKAYDNSFHWLFAWMGAILILDALCVIPFASLRERGLSIYYASFKLANILLNLILVLLFLKFGYGHQWVHHPIELVFIANFISSLATFIAVMFYSRAILIQKTSWSLWKSMAKFGIYIALAGIFYIIVQNIDKQLLIELLPDEIAYTQMGIYSACFKMGIFMLIIIQGIRLGLAPFMFDTSSEESIFRKQYALAIELFSLFLVLGMIGIMMFLPLIAKLFIPNPSYWEGLKIVPYLLIASLMFGLYSFLSMWYQRTNRPYIGTFLMGLGALIAIVVNYLGIPKWGYMASVYGLMGAYIFMFICSYTLGLKYYPLPIHHLRFIFLILTGIGVTWILGHIPSNGLLKYSLGTLALVCLGLLYRPVLSPLVLSIKHKLTNH